MTAATTMLRRREAATMSDWPGWPTWSPARAQKAVRVRALTDPLGALGFRQTQARIEQERRARRAVFLAALASFVGTFAAITLRAAPPEPRAPAPPADMAGDQRILDRTAATTRANAAAAPLAPSSSIQLLPPQPARRVHVRTRAS